MPKQVSKLKCKVNLFQLEQQQNQVTKNIGNVNVVATCYIMSLVYMKLSRQCRVSPQCFFAVVGICQSINNRLPLREVIDGYRLVWLLVERQILDL